MTRRRWLEAAFAGAMVARSAHSAPAKPGGGAKSCIIIYLFGGPSHLDIWDLKPDAPAGIRGEFKPIPTRVPGIFITEHLPQIAGRADKLAIIRSMTHGDNAHGSASHAMLTGRRPRVLGEVGPTPEDFPSIGSVIGKLRPPAGVLPPYVSLPWTISTSTNVVPGQGGGFLGAGWDPFRIASPPAGSEFQLAELRADPSLSAGRLAQRRALLEALASDRLADSAISRGADILQRRAFDLIAQPEIRKAFDLESEDPKIRDRYGRNPFGQGLLLARRLALAGVSLVTLYWPDRVEPEAFINNGVRDKVAVAAWDTHGSHVGATPNFPTLKDKNLPPLDQASAALLDDLEQQGALDETLIVWMGEFGRSPRINGDAGRDHYGNVFSVMLAGGGVKGGCVHGSSDKFGAFPASEPVSPAQLAATIHHCLGIDPKSAIRDSLGRPFAIAEADPIREILIG